MNSFELATGSNGLRQRILDTDYIMCKCKYQLILPEKDRAKLFNTKRKIIVIKSISDRMSIREETNQFERIIFNTDTRTKSLSSGIYPSILSKQTKKRHKKL